LFGPKNTEVAATAKAKDEGQPTKKGTVGFLSGISMPSDSDKPADVK